VTKTSGFLFLEALKAQELPEREFPRLWMNTSGLYPAIAGQINEMIINSWASGPAAVKTQRRVTDQESS
jgi:hypothetical protein